MKARVHLAEIYANQDRVGAAEALLLPLLSSGDPEVQWRLADMLIAQEKFEEAETPDFDRGQASGTPLIQDLRSNVTSKPYEPTAGTDMIMRVHLQTALFENGHVLLPRHAPWLADYLGRADWLPRHEIR